MKYNKHFSEYAELSDSPENVKIQEKFRRSKRRKELQKKKRISEKLYGTPKFADHLKSCSCTMCCNPRHGFKSELTLQEKKFGIEYKKDYKDVLE